MNKFKIPLWCCLFLSQVIFASDSEDNLFNLSFEELTQVKVIIATGIEQELTKKSPRHCYADYIKKTGAIQT